MRNHIHILLLGTMGLVGCGYKAAITELQDRVEVLEASTKANAEAIEASAAALAAKKAATAAAATASDELAAKQLYSEARKAMEALDYDTVRARLDAIERDYANSPMVRNAKRMRGELDVVGMEVTDLAIERWYTLEEARITDGQAKLLVFFETWCSYCQRELPKLAARNDALKAQGLDIIALTKVSRTATDNTVVAFIAEYDLPFPVAKEADGQVSKVFNVSGVPAAAVVKNGKVVWRGHPGMLTDLLVTNIMAL